MGGKPARLAILAGYAATYIIWGSTYLGIRITLETISPFLGGGLRFLAAGTLMLAWAFFRGAETQTDFAEVLRTTGFAFTPGLLRGFGGLPGLDVAGLHLPVTLIPDLWVVLASIVAVRQALDFTTLRAIGTFGRG